MFFFALNVWSHNSVRSRDFNIFVVHILILVPHLLLRVAHWVLVGSNRAAHCSFLCIQRLHLRHFLPLIDRFKLIDKLVDVFDQILIVSLRVLQALQAGLYIKN